MSEDKKSPTTPTKSEGDKIEARLRDGTDDVTPDDDAKKNRPEIKPISDEEVDEIVKRCGKIDKDDLKKHLEFFWSVDTFHFGAFTVHQLAYQLRQKGHSLTNKQIAKIFSDLDQDNDFLVSLDEYLVEMSKPRPKPKTNEELRLWFDRFDVDKDGYVNRSDIRKSMDSLGSNILSAQLDDVMRNDSTGQNEKLNFEDFCYAVKRMR